MNNRREFVIQLSLGGSALVAGQAFAQVPMLAESDATAGALGYKADTTKVDAAKFPKHAAAQLCNNCTLYQGKATFAIKNLDAEMVESRITMPLVII